VKNHEEIERSYIQCGPFSKQQISVECLPLERLESALGTWFKQAHESNASLVGTHLKGAFYIADHLGKPVFWFPVVGSTYARDNIAYRTLIR
jgi:hypothetical protein